ncbi:MAG: Secreted protein containing C-terminal beta-propeller domain distantly related to WD-40 repeat, partial [Parcubacteria group bacterium Gr01-1014_29]
MQHFNEKVALVVVFAVSALVGMVVPTSSTMAATCNPAALTRVRLGQRSTAVVNFQTCLIQMGYAIPAGPTGYYGTQTRAAVVKFYQGTMSIQHDGYYIGPQGIGLLKQRAGAQVSIDTSGEGLKKISSKEELRSYLQLATTLQQKSARLDMGVASERSLLPALSPAAESAGRVSDTTVQVKGIDEPDIVKVDDKTLYVAGSEIYYMRDIPVPAAESVAPSIYPPRYDSPKTSLINAFPPSEMSLKSKVDTSGDMLLLRDKKILAVFSHDKITGYNVVDTAHPKELWSTKLGPNTSVVSSRLYDGKIYLVTRTYINQPDPCPIIPLVSVIVDCFEIYRPAKILPIDASFTAMVLNPETGKAEKELSFLGSTQDSILYMSPNALYITYFYTEPVAALTVKAVLDRGASVFPASVIGEIRKVEQYNISDEAKAVEHQFILDRYYKTISADERLKVENNWNNQLQAYIKEHRRELEKTTIVKIPLDTFTIGATGSVPGYPLNQFALDEYEGNLRVAVTVGERSRWWWGWGSQETANDVYVLNSGMSMVGSIQGLGLSERIYAARFIGDRGYLVTFRQIDPFYVLDLSNPQSPKRVGELKIPGYSSFMVPLAENKILGIGKENNQVKAAIFDVTNPANPMEKDKYILAEGWSEILNNHKAFLLDEKHSIFFVPGSQGGYVFSYAGDKLTLAKAVSGYDVKRAVYLNDYLYIVGANNIQVFNETT